MSGTDKDKPHWVEAEWYEPLHDNCPNQLGGRKNRQCDLPKDPLRIRWRWPRRLDHCVWVDNWDDRNEYRYRYTRPPTKEERHTDWWGPDRAKVRDQMTKAKQEYNGSREVEIVERVNQHRHAPVSGWWD